MRVLLDECIDETLAQYLEKHEVATVRQSGWSGKKNGELLRLIGDKFDAFVTVDQNIQFQQNLQNLAFAIVIIVVRMNVIEELLTRLPKLRYVLAKARPGEVIRVAD